MFDWSVFTPIPALIGGLIIGVSVMLMWLFNGRITGVSGIIGGLLPFNGGQRVQAWQVLFVVGLALSAVIYQLFGEINIALSDSWLQYAIAGLVVGFGTRLGSGCTSGHGICGNARLSPRSIVATLSFMAAGFITVYVARHLLGLI